MTIRYEPNQFRNNASEANAPSAQIILESPGRRILLKKSGALAIARPLAAVGGGLLAAEAAHASTTIGYTSLVLNTQQSLPGPGGVNWRVSSYTGTRSSGSQTEYICLAFHPTDSTKEMAVRNWYDSAVSARRVTWYNTYSSSRPNSVTFDQPIKSILASNVYGDWDGGRRLTEINWELPNDATGVQFFSDIATYSDNVFVFATRYSSIGTNYVKVDLKKFISGSWTIIPVTGPWSGTNYNQFFLQYNALKNAARTYNTAHGRLRTTAALGVAGCVLGAVGAGVTGGLSLSVAGGAIVAFGALSLSASSAAEAASVDLADKLNSFYAWVESASNVRVRA